MTLIGACIYYIIYSFLTVPKKEETKLYSCKVYKLHHLYFSIWPYLVYLREMEMKKKSNKSIKGLLKVECISWMYF